MENNYTMTAIQQKLEAARPEVAKRPSHFQTEYQEFTDVCLENRDKIEWDLCIGISTFYLERMKTMGHGLRKSGKFFQETWAHQVLFYRLLLAAAQAVQTSNSMRMGVAKEELVEAMSHANNASERTCEQIFADGTAGGWIGKLKWWKDNRVTVYYLTPESVAEYLDRGLKTHMRSARAGNLLKLNQIFHELYTAGLLEPFEEDLVKAANRS